MQANNDSRRRDASKLAVRGDEGLEPRVIALLDRLHGVLPVPFLDQAVRVRLRCSSRAAVRTAAVRQAKAYASPRAHVISHSMQARLRAAPCPVGA